MATGKALDGKPYAGNPHVRFNEGEVAPATTPRRGFLLYKAVTFNGRPVMDRKIRHADIVKGGELVFEMAFLKTQKGTGLIGECVKWQN